MFKGSGYLLPYLRDILIEMKAMGNVKGLEIIIMNLTINILDSEFLGTNHYHSSIHLWEDEQKDYMLTDLVENVQKVEERLFTH